MKLFSITEQGWEAMIQSCLNATKSIYVEQYLIENDQIGKRLCRILAEKAKEGVEVKCLFDAFGSFYIGRSKIPQELQASGAEIEFFNWLWPFAPKSQKLLYFRNHRRILIVDEAIAFTGGICFGDRWKNARDTHIQIEEAAVIQKMKEVFTIDWYHAKKRTLRLRRKVSSGANGLFFVTSSPLPRKRYIYYRLITALRHAKQYAYLTTPYLLPDNKLTRALISASRRGVDVRIIIPQNSTHPIVDIGARTYFDYFLRHGIRIFQYKRNLHAKTTVIDDTWATVGSLNLDNISLRYNHEANLIGSNAELIQGVKDQFLTDLTDTIELTLGHWRQRSLWTQFLEMLVYPIRKLL